MTNVTLQKVLAKNTSQMSKTMTKKIWAMLILRKELKRKKSCLRQNL
jgi:hypothetical protein